MALINCSMEKRTVIVSSGTSNVTSIELEIIPDTGYVVAARDFVAGNNPDAAKIQSITLSDTATSGGPQNDGSYTSDNKIKVTVDFVDSFTFTESVTLDIDPSGSATANHLVPTKTQGTFVVPSSPNKITFTASNVEDFASSPATNDFYIYNNPEKEANVMTMTIASTSGDFISEDPTISITNSSYSSAQNEYIISRSDSFDDFGLIQVVYTIKIKTPSVSRAGDVITFTGSGEDVPGVDNKIYGFQMDTSDIDETETKRRLTISADAGSKFRIKTQRGTISGSTFTIDANYGIYVFDNTKTTVASAFEPSTSTTTYPSVINQGDGSYDPATNPYVVDNSGLFIKDIVIPADSTDKVYRFTIIPQDTTTIDASAIGIDTTPDPDVITFDILRSEEVELQIANNSTRSLTSSTINYIDYNGDSKGTTTFKGRSNTDVSQRLNDYSYEIVLTDDVDFHLPNQLNEFDLSELNYSTTLNSGSILTPSVKAELRANSDGFNTGEIQSIGYDSHTHAEAHEPDTTITLTEEQRDALTTKSNFSAESFNNAFTITNNDNYFKIKFFTTDAIPVYKSQTIYIADNYQVQEGIDGQQNTTTVSAPAIDRSKLYINGSGLAVSAFGTGNIVFTHNIDTFAFSTAQSNDTLDIAIGITQGVKEFINGISRAVGYVNDVNYSIEKQVSSDGGGVYAKSNITTSTTHVKFTVSGAFLLAQDRLPANFNTSNYSLVFEPSYFSSQFSGVNVSVDSQPTVTLTNSSGINRKLTIANFTVIIDFNGALSGLSTSEEYFFNANITHRLSNQYKQISDIESEYYPDISSPGLATY